MQIQLITESLTRLLNHSLHAPLSTLMLISPAGQLLASASPLKSSILRSRATLAMSIWKLYCDNKNEIPAALPSQEGSAEQSEARSENKKDGEDTDAAATEPFPSAGEDAKSIQTITLQLTLGILTIRLLNCGLLLIGLSDSTTLSAQLPSSHPSALPSPSTSHGRNPTSNQGSLRGKGKLTVGSPPAVEGLRSSAASDAGSTSTTTGRGREVQALRRRTELCARWLEEELMGYKVADGI